MSAISGSRGYEVSTKGFASLAGVTFGGTMLITVGLFQVLQGIAAIVHDDVYVMLPNYSYAFDLTTWGWVHLIIGAVSIAVGVGALMTAAWALVAGVIIAGLSAIANFAFLPYYPVWSLVIVAFNVFVIWALCSQLTDSVAK